MGFLDQVLQFVAGMMSKGSEPMVSLALETDPAPKTPPPVIPTPIDWTDPHCKITDHFTVEDACMLHSWNRLANEMDGCNDAMKANLVKLCQKMEEVRAFLNCPMNVHCIFRSQQYNIEQKILLPTGNDVHAQGLAIDFDCGGTYTIEQIRQKMLPMLEKFDIRMESATTTWIHLDTHAPGPSGRHFKA